MSETTLPILYSFRRCPYAMRARLALDAAGIAVEHREVLLRDKPASMLQTSPKGTVPVMIAPDGSVIDESLDIMVWALRRNDPHGWLSGDPNQRERVETFLNDFKPHLDRYKYASRYDPNAARGAVDTAHRAKAMAALDAFAAPLAGYPYLDGDLPRLIDIASFPFVRQFAAVERDWWTQTAEGGLRDWLERLLSSERFTRIMAKHPLWSDTS